MVGVPVDTKTQKWVRLPAKAIRGYRGQRQLMSACATRAQRRVIPPPLLHNGSRHSGGFFWWLAYPWIRKHRSGFDYQRRFWPYSPCRASVAALILSCRATSRHLGYIFLQCCNKINVGTSPDNTLKPRFLHSAIAPVEMTFLNISAPMHTLLEV